MAYHIDPYDNAIVLDGFEGGISDSPFTGIADMRNIRIVSTPGEGSVEFKTQQISITATGNAHISSVVTGAAGYIVLTTGFTETPLTFTISSPPTGITSGQPYLAKPVSGTTGWALYATYADYVGGTKVNISGSVTGGTVTTREIGTPTYGCYDKEGNDYYLIDNGGRAWIIPDNGTNPSNVIGLLNGTLTNGNGNGIAAWEGYLLVFRNGAVDYMNLTTTVWGYGWDPSTGATGASALNTGTSTNNAHYAIVGQDNVVYYGDGSYVGSITLVAGQTFNPTDTGTYTWAKQALTIPANDIVNCLAELGVNLLVGGQKNAIYPWDRVSTNYSYPLLLAENWTQRMVTINTNTYIFAGQRGRIYVTNGSQVSSFKKIPDYISGSVEPYFTWGDATYQKNNLYFGLYAVDNSGSPFSDESTNGYGALWAIDLDTNALRLSNVLSSGTYGTLATVVMPIYPTSVSSTPPGSGLIIGHDAQAVDVTDDSPYVGGESTVDFDLIPIGTLDRPRNNSRLEYKLTDPLVDGESISLLYRTDFSSSYATAMTDSTAGNFSNATGVPWSNAQWLQIRAALTSTGTTPSYTRLKEVRITGLK